MYAYLIVVTSFHLKMKSPYIVFVTTDPGTIRSFLIPYIRNLRPFLKISVFSNTAENNMLSDFGLDLQVNFVPIARKISPISDIRALFLLLHQIRKISPSAVHTITPKAGLIGMAVAWLLRVPVRVHCFTGQVWATRSGSIRLLLKMADKVTGWMATDILIDSPLQRAFLLEHGVITAGKSRVLGAGSICGVDMARFSPNSAVRRLMRLDLKAPADAVVCLYVGRLNPEKGVLDLASAFAAVSRVHPTVQLWVVGPDEGAYFNEMLSRLGDASLQVRRVGWTSSPERYMQAADLLCLPSHREGFGCVVIEAAACAVPCLASRIYGLGDAVIEGQTGWMHEPGDERDIASKLESLVSRPGDLKSRGLSAKKYVKKRFTENAIMNEAMIFYRSRLKF